MTLTRAAAALGVSAKTLRRAAELGEVEHPLADGPWIFKRTALETDSARHLAQRARNTSSPSRHTVLHIDSLPRLPVPPECRCR
jgi:hypothetical protein